MSCKKISGQNRQVCIGSLDKLITLNDRQITAPIQDSVDYTETLTENAVVWANVKTSDRGEVILDGSNVLRTVTHKIYIRFLTGITAETWIDFENINYDILNVTDLEESHEWLLLKVTKRGAKSLPINYQ